MKKVWIIKAGEKLPINGAEGSMRTGVVARQLVGLGCDVTWWSSTFDHFEKKHLFKKDTVIKVEENYRLHLIHGMEYKKNISLRRFANHFQEGLKFFLWAKKEEKPDVILVSMPTLDLAYWAAKYGKQFGVKVVVDVRDLWPEIFATAFPSALQGVGKLALAPMYIQLLAILRRADAIYSVSPKILDYALKFAGRPKSEDDKHFWLAASPSPENEGGVPALPAFGISPGDFVVFFCGAFSNKLELDTVFKAARSLEVRMPNVKFLICGNGDSFASYKESTKKQSNVILPGWIQRDMVWRLLRECNVGIIPFLSRKDFTWSIPAKAIEYLSCGLPLLSCLEGELKALIDREKVGERYTNNDVDSLVAAIEKLNNRPEILKDYGKRGERLFLKEFSSNEVYKKLAEHLIKFSEPKA